MRLHSPRALVAAATLVAGAALLAAAPPHSSQAATTAAPATARAPRALAVDTVFTASLSAKNEVPGPGAANGSGSASVNVEPAKHRVCYSVSVSGLQNVTAAHIHHAAAGKDGPPVVMLRPPTKGSAKGCAAATASVIKEIMAHPADFYVNVHDKADPAGAVRGQLMAKGMGM
jgi:hypothetical protein